MLIIQIILLIFVLFALSKTIMRFREGKLRFVWLLFWLILWVAVGVVVARPETASALASLVGVTRGADLVVYIALVVVFYLIFRILIKIEHIEQEITRIVRELALRDKVEK